MRSERGYVKLCLADVRDNPRQPRRRADEDGIRELAGSIAACGMLSPLVVRRADGGYELIAGSRRLRALRMLGRTHADALVLPASDDQSALLALTENVQRENLDCFEEAEAYRTILDMTNMTQDALAARLGRSPSSVANKLRLLKIAPETRALLAASRLGERHARALLRIRDPARQRAAAGEAIRADMSVKQTEALVDKLLAPPRRAVPRIVARDHRLFVNALMHTVKALEGAGFGVRSAVEEKETEVIVTVRVPRVARVGTAKV